MLVQNPLYTTRQGTIRLIAGQSTCQNIKELVTMENSQVVNNTPLPKRWKIAPILPMYIDQELKDFSSLMRQLLYNRGLTSAKAAAAFINGVSPETDDPFYIKDMRKAIERLHYAIQNMENIAIYGDYDADGVTASALMVEFLRHLGADPRIYIPNRFDEGYGLNLDAIEQLAAEQIDLIITVDCGIRSVPEVTRTKELGMSLILTDHHLPGEALPPADAIINPRQQDDIYPDKDLVGVGLAYKLVQAYLHQYPVDGVQAEQWLDLVAIGTIADLAPLIGENRVLVKAGLDLIQAQKRQGLYSMAQVCGLNLEKTNAVHVGFILAPRLNAAGRMESALTAFDLLVTRDLIEAGQLAQKLEVQNTQRQIIMHEIQAQAVELAFKQDPQSLIIFAASPAFSEGVVGLAASRIVEAFYRPAIIGHQDESQTIASCRSIPEFNITHALDQCSDLLVRHGGHAAAAGFTVHNENLPELLFRLGEIAAKEFKDLELVPELQIDREILLENLQPKYIPSILDDLHLLEPTGWENPEAVFCSRSCEARQVRTVGSDGNHLKLRIKAGAHEFDAIAFRQGHWLESMPERIDIAYTFEINEYMGRQSLQLNIKDIKPSREG